MADSFELLRARITIDVSNVKAASLAVAKLQASLNQLKKPIKVDVGKIVAPKAGGEGATKGAKEIAKALTEIRVEALKAELSTKNLVSRIRSLEDLRKRLRGLAGGEDVNAAQLKSILSTEKAIKAAQDRIKNRSLANSKIQIQADQVAARASLKITQDAAKAQERARLQSIQRIIRAAQKAQIVSRDPKTNDARRTELLRRAEELLIQARKRVSATSKEAIQIERQLTAVRRAAEPGIDRLAAKLRSLANITDAASRAPGVSSFVANIARLGSGLLRAVASIAKLGASAIALTAGVAALGVGLALGVSLMIKLTGAAVRAAVAIGRTVLTAAITVLGSALKAILTPLRAVYAELRRLFSIAGMRSFVTETLELAGRMEQIRQQLQLGFGGEADAEFARLRQEADLFGSSLIDLSQSFAKFSLVAKQAGVDIATIRKLFTGIQAAGRVFGINADDLQGIFRALEQISSKGKLTSEELIRQLGDRLPGAFALAARALNRSTAQLVEDLREGTVSAQEFFKAFADQTVLEFYDKAILLSDNLNARLQRLRNLSDIIRVRFGNIFSDTLVFAIERIAQAAIRMRDAFAPVSAAVGRITASFRRAVASMNFETLFNTLATVLNKMTPVIEQFLERLGRIAIVFNGAAIVAIFTAIGVAITKINTAMGSFLDKLQQVTGLDLSTAERAFAAFAAALGKLPEIMTIVIRFTDKMRDAFQRLIQVIVDGFNKITQPSLLDTVTAPFRKSFLGILRDLSIQAAKVGVADKLKDIFAKASADARSELANLLAELKVSQAEIQRILEGEGGNGKNPAADAIHGAADDLRDAMKGGAGDLLSIEEAVRRINAAGSAAIEVGAPKVEQKQQADIAATASNTARMVALLEAQGRLTPFFGRGPGLA